MKISTKLILTLAAAASITAAQAQLAIPTLNSPQTIDFTGFTGAGFSPAPGAGQLDSDAWSILGFDAGTLPFGGTQTTASTDFTRGTSTGGVTTGGVYAFNTGSGNIILGTQPTGTDFTPGSFTLAIKNTSGSTIQDLMVSWDFFYINNADRANSFNLSYSTDTLSSSFIATAAGDTTPELLSATAVWTPVANSITIPNVNIPNNGYFYLRWSSNDITGSGSRDEIGIDNIVVEGITPAITAAFSQQNVCEGAAMAFTDMSTSINGSITSWMWDFGDSNMSTTQNPTHTYAAPGTYNVELIVMNANNDADTVVMPVTVYENPLASFTTTATAGCGTICVGFTDLSTSNSGNITSWMWDFGNSATSTQPNTSACYTQPGTYTAELVVSTIYGCSDSTSTNVTSYAVPTAAFSSSTAGSTVNFSDASTGGSGNFTYAWDFGDGNTDNTANPSHTYAQDGNYMVCLMILDTIGCADTVCQQVPIITTVIPHSKLSEAVLIYPNPSASGIISLDFGNYSGSRVKINVYNILGNKVYEREIISNSLNKQTLDLSKEASGNYFLNIIAGEESFTKRITIK
jgi:PKD repeat protein